MTPDQSVAQAAVDFRKGDSTAADRLHLELEGTPGRYQIVQAFRSWGARYRRGEAMSFPVECIELVEKFNGPDQLPLSTRVEDLPLGLSDHYLEEIQEMGYETLGDIAEIGDRWTIFKRLPGVGIRKAETIFGWLGYPPVK